MASLYEVRIRTSLDPAGVKAGDRQIQKYFDSWVARAKSASMEVEKSMTASQTRMAQSAQAYSRVQTQTHTKMMRDQIRAIEQANTAEIRADRQAHSEALKILREKERAIAASMREEDRQRTAMLRHEMALIEQANRYELQVRRQTHAEAMRILKQKDAEIQRSIRAEEAAERQRNSSVQSLQRQRSSAIMRELQAEERARAQSYKNDIAALRQAEEQKERIARQTAANRQRLATGLQQTGQGVSNLGMGLSVGVTAPVAAGAVGVIALGAEYEKAMNVFQATSRATAEEMRAAGKEAVALGADLTLPATSAADAGDAMTALAKKGFSAQQSMDAARGVLQLSTATMVSTAEAANVVANAVHMFGLEAKDSTHLADLFASAMVIGGTELGELQYAFEQAGPVMATAHVPIETTVALLTELALSGIKSEKAGTSLRAMMIALTAPTDEAGRLLKAMNVEIFESDGRIKSMRDIISQMAPALKQMTDQQKLSTLESIFGRRAMGAAIIVMEQGVEGLDRLTAAQSKQGAAADLAFARMKGLSGAWEGFKSQVETLALTLYAQFAPALTKVMLLIASVAQTIGNFAEAHPTIAAVVTVFAVLAATLGPVLIAFGALISLAGSVITAFGTLSATVTVATAALSANAYTAAAVGVAFGYLAIAITAVVVVVGLLVYAYMSWESAADKANSLTLDQVKSTASAVEQNKNMAAAVQAVSAAQEGSAERHEQLNSIIKQLSPNTQIYINALDSEQKKIAAVTAEIEKNRAARLPELQAQLITLAPGMIQQRQEIEEATRHLENQKARLNKIFADQDPAVNPLFKASSLQDAAQGIKYYQEQLDPLNKAFEANAAKMNLATMAAGYNREAFIQFFTTAGRTREELVQLGNIYDILHPKLGDNASATDKTTEAALRQAAALQVVKSELRDLAQGTDTEQAQIEQRILDVVKNAKNAGEATRLAKQAAADPEVARLIAARRLHMTTEKAARSILEPSAQEMGLSGGKRTRTPMENLQEQSKKLRFEIEALRSTSSKGFELKYQVEGLEQTKTDLDRILKLRHELGLPLRTPLPQTYGAIRDEIRLHEQQKSLVEEITKAKQAQSDAEFRLAGLTLSQTIPLIDAETRTQTKYLEAIRDRKNAELDLTAELKSNAMVRRDALLAEKNTLRDTYQQYVQIQIDSVKAAESARAASIRSQLEFDIAFGREPEVQRKLEIQLQSQTAEIKPPLVTMNERVGTIVKQIELILGAITGRGVPGSTASGGAAAFHSAMDQFVAALKTRGVTAELVSGARSYKQQLSIWNRRDPRTGLFRGNPVAKPGTSLHESDMAADYRFRGPMSMKQIGALAESMGIDWGGDWPKPDPGHFQIRPGAGVIEPQSGRRPTTPPVLKPGPGSPGYQTDDVLVTAARAAGVHVNDEQQYTRLTEAVTRHRTAVTELSRSEQDLRNEQAADLVIREELYKQTGQSLEQLSIESALKNRERDRIASDLSATVAAGVVEHDLAQARGQDAAYVDRVLTDAARSRADAELKTLNTIIDQEEYLTRLRKGDARTMGQVYADLASARLAGQTSLTKQIIALEDEIAHAGEDSSERRRLAGLTAIRDIQNADQIASEQIITSQIKIADSIRFHPIQAQAQLLQYFEQQKTVTQTVVESMQNAYEKLTSRVDVGLSKLLHGLGMVKDIVTTLVHQLISGVFQQFARAVFAGQAGQESGGSSGGLFGFLGGLLGGGGGGVPGLTGGFAGGSGANVYLGGGGGAVNTGLPSIIRNLTGGGGGIGIGGAQQSAIQRLTQSFFGGGAADVPQSSTDLAASPWRRLAGLVPGVPRMGGGAGGGVASLGLKALGTSLGPLAPILGLGLGASLGQGSGLGTILGGIGGGFMGLSLLGGLTASGIIGGGAAAGGLAASVFGALGLGGLSTSIGGIGALGTLAPLLSFAVPAAIIAAPLIIGAIALSINAKRRKEEKARAQLSDDTMGQINALVAKAQAGDVTLSQATTEWNQIHSAYMAQANQLKDKKTRQHAIDWWDKDVAPYYWPKIQAWAKAGEQADQFKSTFVPTYSGGVNNGLVPYLGAAQTLIKVTPGERVDDVGIRKSWMVPGVDRGRDSVYTFASPGSRVATRQQQPNVPGFSNGSPTLPTANQGPPVILVAFGDAEIEAMAKKVPHAVIVKLLKENILTTGGADLMAMLQHAGQRNGY